MSTYSDCVVGMGKPIVMDAGTFAGTDVFLSAALHSQPQLSLGMNVSEEANQFGLTVFAKQ